MSIKILDSLSSSDLSGAQEALVSGSNIKTVGGTSLLGSGDIPVAVAEQLRIGILSDLHMGYTNGSYPLAGTPSLNSIATDISANAPIELLLTCGDHWHDDAQNQYVGFKSYLDTNFRNQGVLTSLTQGNHDTTWAGATPITDDAGKDQLYNTLRSVYGVGTSDLSSRSLSKAVTWKNFLFVTLSPEISQDNPAPSTCPIYTTDAALDWLETLLAKYRGYNVFVLTHAPIAGCGLKTGYSDANPNNSWDGNSTRIQSICTVNKITAWFVGHLHFNPTNSDGATPASVSAPVGFGGTVFVGVPSAGRVPLLDTYSSTRAWWLYLEISPNAASASVTLRNSTDAVFQTVGSFPYTLTLTNPVASTEVFDLSEHTHTNKPTLAKITESAGLPLWAGGAWPGSAATSGDILSPLTAAEITITGATTATIGRMHVCTGTTADYTVGLPDAATNAGKFIGFRMSSGLTKLVTLDGNGSDTINGALTKVMWAGEVIILFANGTNWTKVAGCSLPMGFKAYTSTDIATIPHNTWTQALFDTEDFDKGGVFASSAFTVRRAGLYQINISTAIVTNTPASQFFTRGVSVLYLNGAVIERSAEQWPNGTTSNLLILKATTPLTLAAGDVVTNWLYGTNTAAATFTQQGVVSGGRRSVFSCIEVLIDG